MMWVKWNPISVRLEIVLISTQDRSTICDEHTIGLEIVLDAPPWYCYVMWLKWKFVSVHLEIV